MDAVSCAGVTPQSALLSHSFAADAAIARALHFSLSDNHAPEPLPATTTTTLMRGAVAATDCPPTKGAPSPPPSSSTARCRLGPAGGHAGKRRRPRPSKRAPTTYISTDAATFRAMVQRVTGADEADLLLQQPQAQPDGLGIGLLLPHLGVEQFLLQAAAAGHAPHVAAAAAAAAPYTPPAPPAAAEAAEQQQPLFPTLDSWNVMYGKKNEVVSALTAGQ